MINAYNYSSNGFPQDSLNLLSSEDYYSHCWLLRVLSHIGILPCQKETFHLYIGNIIFFSTNIFFSSPTVTKTPLFLSPCTGWKTSRSRILHYTNKNSLILNWPTQRWEANAWDPTSWWRWRVGYVFYRPNHKTPWVGSVWCWKLIGWRWCKGNKLFFQVLQAALRSDQCLPIWSQESSERVILL